MTTLDILNLQVNAKYLKGLLELNRDWNNPFISIGEIVKLCVPRIEKRQERFEKLHRQGRPQDHRQTMERTPMAHLTLSKIKMQ